jgi:hypothetical protein
MDPYIVGYYIGRYSTRFILVVLRVKLIVSGYTYTGKVAKCHKINNLDPAVVTENVFECLKYID